jgi:hypothetical protein
MGGRASYGAARAGVVFAEGTLPDGEGVEAWEEMTERKTRKAYWGNSRGHGVPLVSPLGFMPSQLLKMLSKKSGREDSNLRPPAPKAGALTRLRYAPT